MESRIERVLLDATKFAGGKFRNRQDYLAALTRAVEQVDERTFDLLTDDAANWYDNAVDAINLKQEIPDFPDKPEAGNGVDHESAVVGAETVQPEPESSNEDDPVPAEEGTEKKPKPKADKKPKKEKVAKADKEPKPAKPRPASVSPRNYLELSGNKDKWGIYEGTKTSDALKMYERGTTAKELEEALGGRYYNILRRMQAEGHLVEKTPQGKWKLTHKDDVK